tara:strand:+ start:640 stop:1230 length:591 start_codon:yes stop_codon:yes gene_type:complete
MTTTITSTSIGLNSLGSYTTSADVSSVFTHSQNAYFTYELVSVPNLDGGWPAGTENKNFYKMSQTSNVSETLTDWAVSGGQSVDTWTCQVIQVTSYDSSTGLGLSGYVHFKPGGFTRAAAGADFEYRNHQSFSEILIPSPIGSTSELKDDANVLNAFVSNINALVRQGGLDHSETSTASGVRPTLPEYGWRTDLMC